MLDATTQYFKNKDNTWGEYPTPSLDNAYWTTEFFNSPDTQRQNIVRAWFWTLYQHTVDLDEPEFSDLSWEVLRKNLELLASMSPYVDEKCYAPKRYIEHLYNIKRLTTSVEETDDYCPSNRELTENIIRKLWLGSTSEKLEVLSMDIPLDNLVDTPWLALLPKLFVDAASAAGNTEEHLDIVRYQSVYSGQKASCLKEGLPGDILKWVELGSHIKYVHSSVAPEVVPTYKKMLVEASPLLAAKVARLIFYKGSVGAEPNNFICVRGTLLYELVGDGQYTEYQLLTKLLPRYSGAFAACEAIGMHYEDALKELATSIITQKHNLPNSDFTSDV